MWKLFCWNLSDTRQWALCWPLTLHPMLMHHSPQYHFLFVGPKWKNISHVNQMSYLYVFTPQIKLCKCSVCLQCITQSLRTHVSDFVFCCGYETSKKWFNDYAVKSRFACSPLSRSRWVTVEFVFNASLNAVAPISPMWFPEGRKE